MKKSETIIIKISKEDKERLVELSKQRRISLSGYIRMLVCQ